ncbi:MAG: M16 family metallopeptidase [Limisphaerales bacterium]
MKLIRILTLVVALGLSVKTFHAAQATKISEPENGAMNATNVSLLLQPTKSPLVTFRILFQTGAAYDPVGKEGVAALTAALVAEGGSQRLTYEEIIKRMYPMATSFGWQVDKEMTVFTGTTHAENLMRYYSLIREMILTPGFREDDFRRLKTDALNFLKVSLREGNDEELGKERLYNIIYTNHPYGHHNIGKVRSLERWSVQDVTQFYRSNFTRANLVIGVAGGFPEDFAAQLQKDFAALPSGETKREKFKHPELEPGMKIEIVQRDTRSTAISMGFPIDVNRAHPDFAALKLVESYFGQHRSSNSHLFQRLREARGLNYGDYSYIEYFPRGMYQFQPDPNLARQEQIFQLWIRPVPPEQAVFTLRAALYEYDKLVSDGLTPEAFEATREFLTKFVDVLLQTQSASLGYALDSRYYDIPQFGEYLKAELAKLTVENVNIAIKRHLKSNQMRVVMVAKDGEALKEAIVSGKPSPITYNSPKPNPIMAEDKIIEKYPIPTKAEWVNIAPVTTVFN